jgi:oxygen-independent coproporphyrinogen-3 oxidase
MDYTKRLKSHHEVTKSLEYIFISNEDKKKYVTKLLTEKPNRPRSIYIHVPYCRKICSFCNMNTGYVDESIKDYHKLIIESIKAISKYPYIQGKDFDSVYFGGGTPTILSHRQIDEILKTIHEYLPISKQAEISMETSISELTEDKLYVMKENGVNRFSIGIQSFVDNTRGIFNRIGDGQRAVKKIEKIMDMGFENTNIDLIYNYPEQSMDELNYDLDIIKSLDIAGISMYSLILHEKSLLQSQIKEGIIPNIPDISMERELFGTIYGELMKDKFKVLELTKMVKENRDEYRYIKINNRGGDCLALGIGAGGKLGNYKYFNMTTKHMIDRNSAPISFMGKIVTDEYEKIDRIIGEMQFGKIDFKEIQDATNFNFQDKCSDFIGRLQAENLVNLNENGFVLNEDGVFWGNNICRELTMNLIEIFKEKY